MQVVISGRECTPTAPKVRQTLALLALQSQGIVSIASLINELWGERQPRSAMTTAQTYIYQLRKMFNREVEPQGYDAPCDLIRTQSPGYSLRLDGEQLDATVFESLYEEGRVLLEQGQPEQASSKLRAALALWRGPCLADVEVGAILRAHTVHLDEARTRALELRIRADVELGRQQHLIPELRSLVSVHPLNEWFHGQLMSALNHAGRRGDALHVYQTLRSTLDQELGLEPSFEIQALQRQLLIGGRA
ncbi:AfsR/SARP family transcriptional regulator [Kitasatospora sp. NBC_01302]|uniref:AfsR/SARP family transcriptional regulator n=1 Tax=Kitasatospora sp. NBC_01302 TaxID=2903575 RepID=UPI002E0D5811|nr:AfsR/SARP family transcriptional regulator [Kitasatospora sp. NBC_01302]